MFSIHYLFRRIFRSLGFSALVVVSIALAIGSVLGVFSVARTILFRSLGVPDAARLIYYTLGNGSDTRPMLSGPAYEALRANPVTSESASWKPNQFRVQTQDGTARVSGAYVSGNAFSVFGLQPSLGHFFSEADDRDGGGADGWGAVLGHSYWMTHFGANGNVVGLKILVDGTAVHIEGVLPPDFTGVSPVSRADILLPRHFQQTSIQGRETFSKPNYLDSFVFGRLQRGVSIQGVQANLNSIEPWFRQAADPEDIMFSSNSFSNTQPGSLLGVRDGRLGIDFSLKALQAPLMATQAFAWSILLFCGCNLILLIVSRSSREAHSLAIRLALGARLRDTVRFAMVEAGVLATIGCLASTPIAWGIALILSRAVQSLPRFSLLPTAKPGVSLSLAAWVLSVTIAVLSAAVASAWKGRKRGSISLKEGRGATSAYSKGWVIGFEVFVFMVLLMAAVVGGIGFQELSRQPSGFSASSAVIASLDVREDTSVNGEDKANLSAEAKMDRILNQIENYPGVTSAAFINIAPLSNASTTSTVEIHGAEGAVRQQQIWGASVSVRYFAAIGTRILRGRGFATSDISGDPVCVVGNRAAAVLFASENPLGEYLYSGKAQPCRVVGVAEDAHFTSMSHPAEVVVYRLSKRPLPNVVVTAANSGLATEAIRKAVKAIDPGALTTVETMQSRLDDDLHLWRVMMLLGALCACIAATIVGIGFFGVISVEVTERKREIGIQIALGANRIHVCGALIKNLRATVLAGLCTGLGMGLIISTRLANIYGSGARLAVWSSVVSLILLLVLLAIAASIPLGRAIRVSPMESLSCE